MTIIPTVPSIGRGVRSCGLGGLLLGAGLLIASVHPGCAGMSAPGQIAVPAAQAHPAAQVQDPGRPEPAVAPSVGTPAPNTPDPVTAVGFGWG